MSDHDYKHGGWKQKYIIGKADGSEVDPDAVYFVLRLDEDPHAQVAAAAYADSVERENSELARDIRAKLPFRARPLPVGLEGLGEALEAGATILEDRASDLRIDGQGITARQAELWQQGTTLRDHRAALATGVMTVGVALSFLADKPCAEQFIVLPLAAAGEETPA